MLSRVADDELPPGWVHAPIGRLCTLRNGRAFKPEDWQSEGLPIVRIQNLNNRRAAFNRFSGAVAEHHRIGNGDLLFAWSGTPGTSFGAHVWRGGDAVLNQHIFRVDFDSSAIDRDYFCHALNFSLEAFIAQSHGGAGLAHITKGRLEETTIPLAPQREQARIASAISEALDDIEAGEAALARAREGLTQFRASLLHAACTGALTADWRAANPTNETGGDLLQQLLSARDHHSGRRARPTLAPDVTDEPSLPPGWCWASVDQITNFLGNGLARAPDGDPSDRRILRISAVRPMKVDDGEHRFYRPLPGEDLAGATTQRHDLLFTRYSGSEQYVGVCGLVRFDDPLLFPDKVMCARPPRGFTDLSEYLELALNSGPSRAYIARNIRTTAGQKGIAGSSIRACPVPLPPRREMSAIVTAVREGMTDATDLPADGFASSLRQSILHAAFTGRLVPQDPADEPATALLARLRAAPATMRRPRQRRATAQPDLIETTP